jgi:hypothetical protein
MNKDAELGREKIGAVHPMATAVVSRLDDCALLLMLKSRLSGPSSWSFVIAVYLLGDAVQLLLQEVDSLNKPINIWRLVR